MEGSTSRLMPFHLVCWHSVALSAFKGVGSHVPFIFQHVATKPRQGGFIFKPLDDAARSGPAARGKWKVHYILLSEAGLMLA